MVEDDGSVIPLETIWKVYRVPILLGCLSLLCIALSITIFIKGYQPTQPITFSSDNKPAAVMGEATISARVSTITVDIEGAVKTPGVYHMPAGSRVDDAINVSGGLVTNADTGAIAKTFNRAAKLSDGAKVYIPAIGESNGNISGKSATATMQTTLVNVNTASAGELDTFSGVGTVTVEKIITGRPYMRLEELVEKKVMSQSVFTKIKDMLTL